MQIRIKKKLWPVNDLGYHLKALKRKLLKLISDES